MIKQKAFATAVRGKVALKEAKVEINQEGQDGEVKEEPRGSDDPSLEP